MANTWPAEKRLYEKLYYAALRRKTKIYDILPPDDEIGYTSSDGNIHLAEEHQVMADLDAKEKAAFRCGVFTHETLHQIYTDFTYLEAVLGRHHDRDEQQIILLYHNLVEDPAIEYFAPLQFGGVMLNSLRYSIRHIYNNAPPLEESQTAFSQFINALIMFGDMGLIKGHFTFDDARDFFKKIIPDFNAGVTNPDAKARVDAAERWMVVTRPLWKKEKDIEKAIQELMQQLQDNGMMSDPPQGGGSPMDSPEEQPKDTKASERRRKFAEQAENEEESSEDGGSGSGKESDEESNEKGNADSDEKGNENSQPVEGGGHDGEPSDYDGESSGDSIEMFTDDGRSGDAGEDDGDIYSVPDELWDDIEKEFKKSSADDDLDTMNIPVAVPKGRGGKSTELSCLNHRVEPELSDKDSYRAIKEKVGRDISLLTNSLKTMLRNDIDEYLHQTSGKYRLKRDLAHTSVRVFDKKKEKKNIDDLAVMLLVDISGSMRGNKIRLAREAAVMLAETFSNLKISCYIMGFTADTAGHSVVHEHYVSWKNTSEERLNLTRIEACANNDDGYSIRYATQMLKRKQAEHKLLFVLSDGAPACQRYRCVDGIRDTALAIQEASKVTEIFGIGIGIQRFQELKDMYKGNYINVANISEVAVALARQLKIVIRKITR